MSGATPVGDGESELAYRASAREVIAASKPRGPEAHLIASDSGQHVFAVDGSRLFDADAPLFAALDDALGTNRMEAALRQFGLARTTPAIDDQALTAPPIHALSLAIAQKCNLGCTYCYAQQGDFGAPATNMSAATADQSVDLLLSGVEPGARVNLAFLGGEPLVNRRVLQSCTRRAARLAADRGINITFSITTNGTLVKADDAAFFEDFGFAVTVSLDGPAAMHDALRPFKRGAGSYDRILRNITPLLATQQKMQVSARVTVTPNNLDLRPTLDHFIALGFHSVGFSPLLRSPGGAQELDGDALELMLGQMIDCGREFERQSIAGKRYPFANMLNALREIERGTHRPYPCGAGAGYLAVDADGDLSACHRFVGDDAGQMGSLNTAVDDQQRAAWLSDRHVHRQEPCRSCWARYLCGGGCHHETIARGRPACDYIRGWLHYCLSAYLRLTPATYSYPQNDVPRELS